MRKKENGYADEKYKREQIATLPGQLGARMASNMTTRHRFREAGSAEQTF
jgi:hypothetical protein